MMSDSWHFTPGYKSRKIGTWDPAKKEVIKDDLEIVKVRCANCGNYVRGTIEYVQVFKLREGDPRIAQMGKDKVFKSERWCLPCVRAAPMEDDSNRTMLGIGYGSS